MRTSQIALIALSLLAATAGAGHKLTAPHTERQPAMTRWAVGETLTDDAVKAMGKGQCFAQTAIPDSIFALMQGRSFAKGCTMRRSELSYLRIVHHDGQGQNRMGEMVCHKKVAAELLAIFEKLYQEGYPIERMLLIDRYGADDERSMRANNTSCFNFRQVAGSTKLSAHSRGMAVDINPLYNPCVRRLRSGRTTIQPQTATKWADRRHTTAYHITAEGRVRQLFRAHGWTWGGAWRSVKDYQHFEKNA